MASNLRVDNIQPSTGTGIGIGTANGSVTIAGDLSVDTSKGLTVGTGATISGGTNYIAASTNGSERVRILSNGRVGIGTVIPIRNVHISGTTTNILRLENTNANVAGIELTGSTGQSSIFHNNDDLRFLPAGTERLRVTSGGNVEITNGNLVFSTSGTGIDFSATTDGSGTVTSELLDDYEEGTWTPYLSGFSSGSITYSIQGGNYVRIGNLCYIQAHIGISVETITGGTIELNGLPYIFPNSNPGRGGLCIHYAENFFTGVTMYYVSLRAESNVTRARFNYSDATDGQINSTLNGGNINAGSIFITGTYHLS